MKVTHIGNYPPRCCGIATFTEHLVRNMKANDTTIKHEVIAIVEPEDRCTYPGIVTKKITRDNYDDYRKVASQLCREDTDIFIIQHEFGIFGGEEGKYIADLIDALNKPIIITMHTVLEKPSNLQKMLVQRMARKANRLAVMSNKAVELLIEHFQIPQAKIEKIEHGAPVFELPDRHTLREQLGFADEKLIISFGLLGKGKGVETMIKALPKVVQAFPKIKYVYLGKTHPNVLKNEGEKYRESLLRLACDLGMKKQIEFKNEFVDERKLFEYLKVADLYVTPYPNKAQITSGTLSYAVSMGVPTVSTPYWHAEELLAEGKGKLFGFNDHEGLGDLLLNLFSDEKQLVQMRTKSKDYGKTLAWSLKSNEYLKLAKKIVREQMSIRPTRRSLTIPENNWRHLLRLTDQTGMVQHAKYAIPNYHEGYCIDDNARALILTCQMAEAGHLRLANELAATYIAFIFYAQRKDGWFHNFMGYDRRFLDEIGSEDSQGRTVWALGHFLAFPVSTDLAPIVEEMFDKAKALISNLKSPRAVAFSLLGLTDFLQKHPSNEEVKRLVKKLGALLAGLYHKTADGEWDWFEEVLAYANAVLPLAMLKAYRSAPNPEWLSIVENSLRFLEKQTFLSDYFQPIGCRNFMHKGEATCEFDQQPLDATLMVMLYKELYVLMKKKSYYEKAQCCYNWFLGVNVQGIPLYNPENGGCFDGLTSSGVNQNQGAESTLAFWLAHFSWQKLQQLRNQSTSSKLNTQLVPINKNGMLAEGA